MWIGGASAAKSGSTGAVVGAFTKLLGVELAMLCGSAAAPAFYASLFKQQARGETAGCFMLFLLPAGWQIYEHSDTIFTVVQQHAATSTEITALVPGVAVPIVILLSIVTGSRLPAILSAFGVIVVTLYNVGVYGSLKATLGSVATRGKRCIIRQRPARCNGDLVKSTISQGQFRQRRNRVIDSNDPPLRHLLLADSLTYLRGGCFAVNGKASRFATVFIESRIQ